MKKISAFVICQNEINSIHLTIASLQKVADEIIVVDGGSIDGTVEFLKQQNVQLYERSFDDYVTQKEYAQNLCQYDWLLNLDADEELSKEIIEEIQCIKANGNEQPMIYSLKMYFVDPFQNRLSTWNPYIQAVRFYHKKIAEYSTKVDSLYKDRVLLKTNNTSPIMLKGAVWHRSKKNTHQLLAKINAYTSIQAKEMIHKNKKTYPFLSFVFIPFFFFKFYILRRYFMLGMSGFYDSFLWSIARYIRDLKVHEGG